MKKPESSKPAADLYDDATLSHGERRKTARERRKIAPARTGRVSSGLALIFATIALLASGYLWYTLVFERPELLKMDMPEALEQLERTTGELQTTVSDTEDQLSVVTETQNTLRAAVEKIQTDLGRNQAQWIVSEAEQLLLIANRRLQLARDVNSSLAALRAADRQLELLASPSLLPVRREIAREISLLESLERTDIGGLSLRLAALADSIDALALAQDLRAVAAQSAAVQTAAASANASDSGRSIWQDLLSLVRIREHEGAQRPLLPPDQQYFARENLRLMLYGAQHALLQGNVATYQQNLKTAARWVNDYFDRAAQPVTAVQAELERLRTTPVMTELPDITPSLEMLRKASGRRREP